MSLLVTDHTRNVVNAVAERVRLLAQDARAYQPPRDFIESISMSDDQRRELKRQNDAIQRSQSLVNRNRRCIPVYEDNNNMSSVARQHQKHQEEERSQQFLQNHSSPAAYSTAMTTLTVNPSSATATTAAGGGSLPEQNEGNPISSETPFYHHHAGHSPTYVVANTFSSPAKMSTAQVRAAGNRQDVVDYAMKRVASVPAVTRVPISKKTETINLFKDTYRNNLSTEAQRHTWNSAQDFLREQKDIKLRMVDGTPQAQRNVFNEEILASLGDNNNNNNNNNNNKVPPPSAQFAFATSHQYAQRDLQQNPSSAAATYATPGLRYLYQLNNSKNNNVKNTTRVEESADYRANRNYKNSDLDQHQQQQQQEGQEQDYDDDNNTQEGEGQEKQEEQEGEPSWASSIPLRTNKSRHEATEGNEVELSVSPLRTNRVVGAAGSSGLPVEYTGTVRDARLGVALTTIPPAPKFSPRNLNAADRYVINRSLSRASSAGGTRRSVPPSSANTAPTTSSGKPILPQEHVALSQAALLNERIKRRAEQLLGAEIGSRKNRRPLSSVTFRTELNPHVNLFDGKDQITSNRGAATTTTATGTGTTTGTAVGEPSRTSSWIASSSAAENASLRHFSDRTAFYSSAPQQVNNKATSLKFASAQF